MKTVDQKCHQLAEIFTEDTPATAEQIDDLARTIQQAIEDWLTDRDEERQATYDDYVENKLDEWRLEGGPKPTIRRRP